MSWSNEVKTPGTAAWRARTDSGPAAGGGGLPALPCTGPPALVRETRVAATDPMREPTHDPSGSPAPDQEPERPQRPRLPLHVRIGLFLLGWLLVLVGVAGLVLPGIQGVLTILIGAALLSLVSEIAYELLRKSLRRWPWAWDRVERFRGSTHDRLHRWFHRGDDEPPSV